MRSIALTEEDLENERILYEMERIFPLTDERMFSGGCRCIMTAQESWKKLDILYQELLDKKLTTSQAIIRNADETEEITRKHRLGSVMSGRVYNFAQWWETTDLPKRIRYDIGHGRKNEFELRDELARTSSKKKFGMGWKISSYWLDLMGYENVVAIDGYMFDLLISRGYRYNHRKIRKPNMETVGAPKENEYKTYEKKIHRLAAGYGVTPAQFQRIVWIKSSGWKPRN
jgi:thermostable 8-oxoguanine DNA glycosylase